MEELKRNKGITLVVLVITIIILLILAGITISQLSATGIFEKVKEAKEKWENKQELEEEILNNYENQVNEIIGSRDAIDIPEGTYKLVKLDRVTLSGSGTTYKVSAKSIENWENLTTDNFICDFISFSAGKTSGSNGFSWNLSRNYNSTTGEFEISRGGIPGSTGNIVVDIYVYY